MTGSKVQRTGAKKKRKHPLSNPCPHSPAIPASVVFHAQAREARTHLTFDGRISWARVTVDTDGFPTTCDAYETQWRATDSSGVPAEADDVTGKQRRRGKMKVNVEHFNVVDAEDHSGVFTFTLSKDHDLKVGGKVDVSDVQPNAYNGSWTITNIPADNQLKVNGTTGVADLNHRGTLYDADDSLHVITDHLPRPKTLYWQARVRAHAGTCWGEWSEWTSPVLPWTGADPKPPAPDFTSYNFNRKGGKKHNAFYVDLEWDETINWDVPGGDREPDMSRYRIVAEVQEGGAGAWAPFDHKVVEAKDGSGDTSRTTRFSHLRRANKYRFYGRGIDRFNRRGDDSGYYPSSAGVAIGGGPGAPTNVHTFHPRARVLRTTWDPPANDDDVVKYRIRVYCGGVLRDTDYTDGEHHHYHVPEADRGTNHRVKVTSVDEDGNLSSEVDEGSDTAETTDVITLDQWADDFGAIHAGEIYGSLFSTGTDASDTTSHIEVDSAGGNKDRIRFISSGGGETGLVATGDGVQIGANSSEKVGFFGASPVNRPAAITGSRSGGAALTSLLSKLDSLGIIVDSSSA